MLVTGWRWRLPSSLLHLQKMVSLPKNPAAMVHPLSQGSVSKPVKQCDSDDLSGRLDNIIAISLLILGVSTRKILFCNLNLHDYKYM